MSYLKHVTQVDHPVAEDLNDMPLDCLAEIPHEKVEVFEVGDNLLVVVPLRELVV